MFYFHIFSSLNFVSGYTIFITRVIAPIGTSSVMKINMKMVTLSKIIDTTSVMKINMKMVILSKMYNYNFTLKKKIVSNYLYLTQKLSLSPCFLFQY